MSVQSNYPNLRPALLLDFANTRQLDSRVTFTRSTPACHYDGKTTAMAEQNLLYPSVNIGSPYQNASNTLTNNTGTSPDGTTTASLLVPNTTNTRHYCSSPLGPSGTLGIPYTISVYAKASGYNYIFVQFSGSVSSGGSRYGVTFNISTGAIETSGFSYSYNVSSTSSTITSVGSGWYRITLTASMTLAVTNPMCYVQSMPLNGSTYGDGGDGLPSYAGDGTSGAYFWGFQLEQRSAATAYTVTTTQPITNYIPVLLSAGGNQARFDCNPTTGESLGLLIEEQRTNIALNSNDYANTGVWVASNSSVTSNNNVAPDGTLTADTVIPNTSNVAHDVYQAIATASAITYTYSVYVKANGYTLFNIRTYPSGINVVYNLTNQTIDSSSGTNSGTSITSIGNSWYRLTLTFVTSSTTTYISTQPTASGYTVNTGNTIFAGNGFSGAFVWGAQLEVGFFATSYIATTSASATRTVDFAQMTGANFSSWYNQSQGTLYAEGSPPTTSSTGRLASISTTNTSSTQVYSVNFDGSNVRVYQTNASGSLVYNLYPFSGYSANTFYRIVSAYQNANNAASVGAGTVATNSSDQPFGIMQSLTIGALTDGIFFLNGPIKKIAYYSLRVTNAQLQALTS